MKVARKRLGKKLLLDVSKKKLYNADKIPIDDAMIICRKINAK